MRGLRYFFYKPGGSDDIMLIVVALGLFGLAMIYGIDYLQKIRKQKRRNDEVRKEKSGKL